MNRTIFASLLVLLAVSSFADDLLPVSRYQRMSLPERRQFDKASGLVEQNKFRAAAAEFEKFKLQFPNSNCLPYAILMQGRSLHKGNFRHKAIQVYQEVLDYFGPDFDPASRALYLIGIAWEDNGDPRKSLQYMQEMADHEEYSRHALAAGAMRRLADYHYSREEYAKALTRWKQIYENFRESSEKEAAYSRGRICNHLLKTGQFKTCRQWLLDVLPVSEEESGEEERDFWIVNYLHDLCWDGIGGKAWKFATLPRKDQDKIREDYLDFLREHRPLYEKRGEAWTYHTRHIRYTAERMEVFRQRKNAIDEAMEFLRTPQQQGKGWTYFERMMWISFSYIKDDVEQRRILDEALAYVEATEKPAARWALYQDLTGRILDQFGDNPLFRTIMARAAEFAKTDPVAKSRDQKFIWLSNTVKGLEEYEQALRYLDSVQRPALRLWQIYEIVGESLEKWKEAVQILEQIEKTNDREFYSKAREARAAAYRGPLAEYARAISMYYEIDDPPRTLWIIQDCHILARQLDQAINTLKEIESIFPKEAPKAAWTRAQYYSRTGQSKMAIAESRRILKIYPKAGQSSQAHQLLEKYGIATGGGVEDDDVE
ncbi:MAG: tetratricopeptide (TPR) repeat protein [Rhodothermales bacterium]|jgi:tetratricopeptide (TPR) repeat protein